MDEDEVARWRQVVEAMVPVRLAFNDREFAVLARNAEEADLLRVMLGTERMNRAFAA